MWFARIISFFTLFIHFCKLVNNVAQCCNIYQIVQLQFWLWVLCKIHNELFGFKTTETQDRDGPESNWSQHWNSISQAEPVHWDSYQPGWTCALGQLLVRLNLCIYSYQLGWTCALAAISQAEPVHWDSYWSGWTCALRQLSARLNLCTGTAISQAEPVHWDSYQPGWTCALWQLSARLNLCTGTAISQAEPVHWQLSARLMMLCTKKQKYTVS